MTRPTILIAAFSGRSLAVSARRAGYTPLVVDAFGDTDLTDAAQHTVCLRSAIGSGFRKKSLIRALDRLTSRAATPPVGLVLGSGFEDNPALIDNLADKFQILANKASTVTRSKDPAHLFALLKERGIPHPQTSISPPRDKAGWISKRIGGSGGLHIARCAQDDNYTSSQNIYFQRELSGTPVSLSGVVSAHGLAIGVCRQWLTPTAKRPYRFGGLVSPTPIDPDTQARMIDTALELTRALDLKGFVSFDFLITETDVLFLEVNPRPTAAIDVLDGPDGHMIKAHVSAFEGRDPTGIVAPRAGQPEPERHHGTRALAYLYADRGALTMPHITWPPWACDRPREGTTIKRHRPLATVTATAHNDVDAQKICAQRLGELQSLLYGAAR